MLATLQESLNYFASRPLCDDWNALIEDERVKFLALANAKIESLNFIGSKTDNNQITIFPRTIRTNSQPFFGTYQPFLETCYANVVEVPEEVKAAVFEEAFAMFKYMDQERYGLQEQGVRTASRGGLSEGYESYRPQETILSSLARQYLSPWIVQTANM